MNEAGEEDAARVEEKDVNEAEEETAGTEEVEYGMDEAEFCAEVSETEKSNETDVEKTT